MRNLAYATTLVAALMLGSNAEAKRPPAHPGSKDQAAAKQTALAVVDAAIASLSTTPNQFSVSVVTTGMNIANQGGTGMNVKVEGGGVGSNTTGVKVLAKSGDTQVLQG